MRNLADDGVGGSVDAVERHLLIALATSATPYLPSIILSFPSTYYHSPLSSQWLLLESETIASRRIIVTAVLQVSATVNDSLTQQFCIVNRLCHAIYFELLEICHKIAQCLPKRQHKSWQLRRSTIGTTRGLTLVLSAATGEQLHLMMIDTFE